jgi:hypothetical protein
LSVDASINFRDKARMKNVLKSAGVPCARHALVGSLPEAETFAEQADFPLVVKPTAGAGGKSTFRIDGPGVSRLPLSGQRRIPESDSERGRQDRSVAQRQGHHRPPPTGDCCQRICSKFAPGMDSVSATRLEPAHFFV